jgi:hypothetical protein
MRKFVVEENCGKLADLLDKTHIWLENQAFSFDKSINMLLGLFKPLFVCFKSERLSGGLAEAWLYKSLCPTFLCHYILYIILFAFFHPVYRSYPCSIVCEVPQVVLIQIPRYDVF